MPDIGEREQLERDGFLALPAMFTPGQLADVAARLDRLWSRFGDLPRAHAQDIAATGASPAPLRNPEINRALKLDPGLARTAVFLACRAKARELRGALAACVFDHAIAKMPQGNAETPWHQDQAFTGHRTPLRTVHFWIPLQDVDESNGCMHFVPGSHHRGLLPHEGLTNASGGTTMRACEVRGDGAVVVPMAAGGCTVHTPLTLHFTGANRSPAPRRAWILHFGPFGRPSKLHPRLLFEKYMS
jgi:hypothetical protein